MENKHLKVSMIMAIAMGIFLPLAETIRRIHEILVLKYFFNWFDDYAIGIVLLIAAFSVWNKKPNATAYLIAAWGMATGGLFLSLFGQLRDYFQNIEDPGIFSSSCVLIAKLVILIFILIGLYKSIKANRSVTTK